MRKFSIILLALIFICSCAAQKTITKEEPNLPVAISAAPVQPPDKPVLPVNKDIQPLFGKLLKDVTTSMSSMNPSHKETITLSYLLSRPAKTTINIYDPDLGLIRTFPGKTLAGPGKQTLVWDGTDMDGNIVPDEAYFFTIIAEDESGAQEIYDPTTFSGGVEHDITTAHIDPQYYTINYAMPEMGRVMIRMGIQGGPLMNQLVDWKPRVKGATTEYWNGKDKDNLIDIFNDPKFKMIVTYFSLPENSVITFGNKSINFIDYKNSIAAKRPLKPNRETAVTRLSHHYNIPRTVDYTPDITVQFTNTQGKDKNGLPILNKKTMVKVALDEKDKAIFQKYQFEICFFLDNAFYAEDETGYTPFNWVWDLSNVPEGEHLLTVNITSFQDQIGLLSQKSDGGEMRLLKQSPNFSRPPFFSSCTSCSSWCILLFLSLILSSCASLKTLIHNKPHAIPVEPVYNFEFAGPEQEITHTFLIKNAGNLPLRIEDVSPECGCATISMPETEIPSGNCGEVITQCKTMRYEGAQEKHITVHTNDPENPEIILILKGTIKRDVVVVPQGITFGTIKKGETPSRRIRILQLSSEKLILEKVEADERYYTIRTSWFDEENSRGFDIDVTLKPDVPAFTINDVITLHTNVKKRPRIDVMVWADVKE